MSAFEQKPESLPPPDDCRWRVLRAKPKGEHLAAHHLRREGFEAFCPRLRHQKKTTRGPVWFVEAMFPGYIFCRFSIRDSLRHVVSTAFVSQALTFMHDAGSVPDAVVEDLKREFDDKETITIECTVQLGDSVNIVAGPMSGSEAVVTQVLPGKERVRVLLEFIGGLQQVEVPLLSLITSRDPRGQALRRNN
ncbi:MAG: hypothetical protein JWM59_621 [Verrucomicrobiales bacterium]|nr:hypothetical protein [Verrucomicrobiales bacterium]